MLNTSGVAIIDTRDFRIIKQLEGYGEDTYGLSFSRDGRLVTASFDGWIRLYDSEFNLIKKVQPQGGNMPQGIAYSPDRQRIAVGFLDSNKVDVVDGADQHFLYKADSTGIQESYTLSSVTWSRDSRVLYAGGKFKDTVDGRRWNLVRRWDNQGHGEYTDFPGAARNTITDLAPMGDGGLLVCSTASDWSRLDSGGGQRLYQHGSFLTFLGTTFDQAMNLNSDASIISFKSYSGDPLTFSLSTLNLKEESFEGSIFTDQRGSISMTDWKYNRNPKINGNLVDGLKQHENSNSVSVDPSGTMVVLGCSFELRAYSSDGRQLWHHPLSSVNMAVNCADDGKTVVSATADGLLHWVRLSDGKELLTLFVHSDRKRWVLWTPSGYYACSPGGEDLIGWHVNNGADQAADFYTASRFSDRFYRPDIVSLMLETLNEDKAVAQANGERNIRTSNTQIASILPPVLTILAPSDGSHQTSSNVEVRYSVRTPNGDPLQEIRAMVNGRPVETARGLKVVASGSSGTEKTVSIPLSPGENYISLMGKNSSA